jgi:hypothetical protein
MRKGILILTIIFLLAFTSACSNSIGTSKNHNIDFKQLTTQEKLEDFEAVYTILKENYPYFEVNKRLHGIDWLGNKEKYIEKVKETKDDEEFVNVLLESLADLNNGHTHIVDVNYYNGMKEIARNNNIPNYTEVLSDKIVIERYENYGVKLAAQKGREIESIFVKDNVATELLEGEKLAYLGIKSFMPESMNKDGEIISDFLSKIQEYKTLVIDLRGNSGGSELYWMKYLVPSLIKDSVTDIRYLLFPGGEHYTSIFNNANGVNMIEPIENIDKENLINLPKEAKVEFKEYLKIKHNYEPSNLVNFKGKIYVIIDKHVFSASESFAVFVKSTGFATLIGEKTGGDGIGANPALYALPHSGFILRYSPVMGLTADGTCNEEFKTEPDILVDVTKTDDIKNDVVIKKIIELEKK